MRERLIKHRWGRRLLRDLKRVTHGPINAATVRKTLSLAAFTLIWLCVKPPASLALILIGACVFVAIMSALRFWNLL